MGVTLTTTRHNHKLTLSYTEFTRLRIRIAKLIDKEFGEHYSKLFDFKHPLREGNLSSSFYAAHRKEGNKLILGKNLNAQVLSFLYQSEISGEISCEACEEIKDLLALDHNSNLTEIKDLVSKAVELRTGLAWY